ncbi:DNA-binding response regulator [Amycolatopsis sp. cg5]|uniref:DNA-binding response regulator n=1 Tax=Amycolatopsis sp. cg5 TaxID=3238802 RepID=UPI0035256FDF
MDDVVVVRGEQELFARTAHLFARADEVSCAANDLHTWAASRSGESQSTGGKRIRKVYRPGVLLDSARELRHAERLGVQIRITTSEVNETIILDSRIAILAGDKEAGSRAYSVVSKPELVQGIVSLFEAAWRGATELSVYDADFAELRRQAPQILDLLSSGCKDETAARTLGLGLRTYRRRVAELMDALGATSRFQAGARAREVGIL